MTVRKKYEIRRVSHVETIRGERVVKHRYWVFRPDHVRNPWEAEHVGTWDECVATLRAMGW